MANKLKLTPTLQQEIVDALITGATIEMVCASVGISKTIYYQWIECGLAWSSDSSHNRMPHLIKDRNTLAEFAEVVIHAQAQAHMLATEALHSALLPSEVVHNTAEVVTETRINAKTNKPYTYTKEIKRSAITENPPDWRAAVEFLKRRDATNWGATLKINIDVKLVIDAIDALKALGHDPATVFNDIIARAKVEQDANSD